MALDLERRVRRAGEILNDEMITEAFAAIERNIFDRWQASSNAAEREFLWNERKGFMAFRRHFETVLNTGKLELPKKEVKTYER